jgi:hypothetical protein
MKPLDLSELQSLEDYERDREGFRQRIIALKQRRRIQVGDRISLVFENRETVRFQVQEMLRAERISDPLKIQQELDVYNALLPPEGELSATLFIEITEQDQIKPVLDALQGIDRGETVALTAGSEVVWGVFEGGRSKEDKLSAVHFVRFRPSHKWLAMLTRPGSEATVSVRHPAYQVSVPVPEPLRQEWLVDLGLARPEGVRS